MKKKKAKGEINDWKNAFVQKGDKQLLVKRTSLRRWFCKKDCLPIEKKFPNSVTIVISDAGKTNDYGWRFCRFKTNYHAGNIVKNSQKEIKVVVVKPRFRDCRWKNLAGIENALNKALEI